MSGLIFKSLFYDLSKLFIMFSQPLKENEILSDENQNKIITASMLIKNNNQVVAFTFLLIFLRFFKYLPMQFRKMEILNNLYVMLEKSSSEFISFIIFFLTMLLSFVLFSYLYFGMHGIAYFINVPINLLINFTIPIGLSGSSLESTFLEMFRLSPFISIVYLFCLIIFMKYIILKMLLAIIIYYFKITDDEYQLQLKKDLLLDARLKSKVLDRNFYMELALIYYRLMNKCCGKKKDSPSKSKSLPNPTDTELVNLNPMKKEEKNEENPSQLNEKVDETKKKENSLIEKSKKPKIANDMFLKDSICTEDYIIEMKNRYFFSESDELKLKSYYENLYKGGFKDALLNILFIGVLAVTMIFNILAPWQYLNQRAVNNKLDENGVNYYYSKNISEIRDFTFKNLRNKFFDYDSTNNRYIFYHVNELIGKRLLLSSFKLPIKPNTTFDENIRVYDPHDMIVENASTIIYENKYY